MTPTLRRYLLLLAPLAFAACGGPSGEDALDDEELEASDVDLAEAALRTNSDPNRVVVYSNNIENMIFDWKDLVHEMETAPLRPDIFLVQQLSGREELQRLIAFMNRRLGVDYDGIVAQNHPTDDRFDGQVIPRPRVTTGIIFRSARFSALGHQTWMPWGSGFSGQAQTCDRRSNNSGYESLRVRLHDRRANQDVAVVSLRHWTWHPCSAKNLAEIVNGNDGSGSNAHAGLGADSALHIVAGDFNDGLFEQGRGYACWYRQANREIGKADCGRADHGFTDPLYTACSGDVGCMRNRGGIDSLLVRRGDGQPVRTDHFDIISWEEGHRASVQATGGDGPSNIRARDGYADQADRYSGHEARRAYVYYR